MTARKLAVTYRRHRHPSDEAWRWDYTITDSRGDEIGGGANHPSKALARAAAETKAAQHGGKLEEAK